MPSPSDRAAEERVLRQLAAALIYEGIVDARPESAEGARVCVWSLGEGTWRCRCEIGPFGRPRVGPVEVLGPDGRWRPAELAPLVDALPGGAAERAKLGAELARTVALCRWNAENLPRAPRRDLPFHELDARFDEGHPYHPSFKARTGFSDGDHRAYGPEAGGTFQLVWLAVARERLDQAFPTDEAAFWAREIGGGAYSDLLARMAAAGAAPDCFGLCPVHPWQWERLKDEGLAPLIAFGDALLLGVAGPRYRASQSVRTLIEAATPERANVKLAMSMGVTSALRTIEPHSVAVAPALSDWLAAVVAGDPALDRLTILKEYAGVIVDRDGPLGGQVAALWRQSASEQLKPGEDAAPFNALFAVEPDGEPFVAPWLRRHGVARWVDRLIEVAVLPVWRLLAAHGVATEAHGQNMILVHRDGWPERLMLRDFHDSVEIVPGFLADPEAFPDFPAIDPAYATAAPNTFFAMDRIEELRALVMDALFVFNLTELSGLLARTCAFPETEFWRRVESRLVAAEPGLAGRSAALGWNANEIAVERLLARKLDPSGPRSRMVPNALALSSASLSEAS